MEEGIHIFAMTITLAMLLYIFSFFKLLILRAGSVKTMGVEPSSEEGV